MGKTPTYDEPMTEIIHVRVPDWVNDFYKANPKIKPRDCLIEWIHAHKPRDQSAADFRIGQIHDEKRIEDRDYNRLKEDIDMEHEERVKALDAEIELLKQQKSNDLEQIQKLLPKLLKEKPHLKNFIPESWKGDMTRHPWFEENGCPQTYDTIYRILNDRKGEE